MRPTRAGLPGIGASLPAVPGRPVARHRELGVAFAGIQNLRELVEESRKHLVQIVAAGADHRIGEADRDLGPVLQAKVVVRVEALNEVPGPSHRGRVEDVEEGVRTEREGVFVGRFLKPLLERGDAAVREDRVVADEVGEEVVEVPERVVHRRRGEEEDLPRWIAAQKLPQRTRTLRVRVPEGVRLVDHDQ